MRHLHKNEEAAAQQLLKAAGGSNKNIMESSISAKTKLGLSNLSKAFQGMLLPLPYVDLWGPSMLMILHVLCPTYASQEIQHTRTSSSQLSNQRFESLLGLAAAHIKISTMGKISKVFISL